MPQMKSLPALLLLAALLPAAPSAHAQRLSPGVHPLHYDLTLAPDLKAATFTGDENIDLNLDQPTDTITLNAIEIAFQSVAAGNQTAAVTLDAAKQQASFRFPQTLPAGKVSLHIQYTGILNNELRGFYLSKTAKRNYAVTQFESTDARRAYPSFDEPALKATYTITLVIDSGDTAISNTNLVSDTPGTPSGPAPGKHTLKFAETPKMSTYLVAFLVGDFQCISGSADSVPIRACATPDQVERGKFALASAEFILHWYNTYFGIKYPMPKLDMIAIPDFEAGAMENFGAITYRETDLLIDEKTASTDQKKNVASVVAHEMAHQWFGDMVTMQWWDNLWLNEGFATWMENKPVAAWHPEWNIPLDEASGLDGTMNYDSQQTTRTIRATADTPDEINQMFDGITYGKGGAVLSMVEHYLGAETFRQGVHNYLAAHLYANATAEDFWNAQTANSGKPVNKIMASFIDQPGVPVLSLTLAAPGKVEAAQQRFFLSPDAKSPKPQTWNIPVCFKSKSNSEPDCQLLDSATASLATPGSSLLYANAGGRGYYRTAYSDAEYRQIVANVESALTPAERINLLGDQWALMRSGRSGVGEYLDLVSAVRNDPSAEVVGNSLGKIGAISGRIASDDDRKRLAVWLRQQLRPAYDRIRTPGASDSYDRSELRATLFGLLGVVGEDPEVIADARAITDKFIENAASVDPTLARTASAVAAFNGDAALFDRLLNLQKTSPDPEIRAASLGLLARFRDPVLIRRALDYAVSGQVKNQDAIFVFVAALQSTETRPVAWQYLQDNWDKVKAQLTTAAGGYLVGSTSAFCSVESRDQVTSFFSTHPVPSSGHSLERAVDSINDCISLHARQEPKLKTWLDTQKLPGE